jgi:serine/threonine protein kinase
VYEAVQEPLGRKVALKVLPASPDRTPEQRERFRREASLAAKLHHTNIVPVFAVGESLGLSYYAMQFIAGQSLDRWLCVWRSESNLAATTANANVAPTRSASVEPAEVASPFASAVVHDRQAAAPAPLDPAAPDYHRRIAMIGTQAADALHYAHAQGVLHRDVKPANLMLDERLEVWITDFGLARGDGRQALAIQERLAQNFPAVTEYQTSLAGTYVNLANLLRKQDAQAALEPLDKAIERLDRVLRNEPRQASARRFLRNAHRVRANTYDQLAQHAAAAMDWEQALALEQGTSVNTTARSLCLSLARAGQHRKAAAAADKLAARVSDNLLLDLARAYAISATAAMRDQSLKPQERAKLAEAYAAKAIELIERAAKAGQLGRSEPLKDSDSGADFASLRAQAAFRSLLERVSRKARSLSVG